MFKNIFDKNIVLIIVLCFLTTTVYMNFWTGEILLTDKLMGFTPVKVKFYGVLGCYTKNWMQVVTYFVRTLILAAIIFTGFLSSKKAFENKSTKRMIFSAFLLFPIANGWADKIYLLFIENPLWFSDKKTFFEQQQVPIFGNAYMANSCRRLRGQFFPKRNCLYAEDRRIHGCKT